MCTYVIVEYHTHKVSNIPRRCNNTSRANIAMLRSTVFTLLPHKLLHRYLLPCYSKEE